MVKNKSGFIAATAFLLVGSSHIASAQITAPPNVWTRGTTENVFAGAASAPSSAGVLAGGAIGWEITPRLAVEGSGSWFSHRHGATAFAADLKALVHLLAVRPVAPFIEGGFGVYRATFDSTRGELPGFYQRRLDTAVNRSRVTFTDPSFILGAGVDLFLNRHVTIRPDVEAKIVRRNSSNYVVTALSVHVAYHFEDHPITPIRSEATQ
jgi:hypothetical protein